MICSLKFEFTALICPMKNNDPKSIFSHFHYWPVLNSRAVVGGGAGGAFAPPEFGSSPNTSPARGGRLCPSHYR